MTRPSEHEPAGADLARRHEQRIESRREWARVGLAVAVIVPVPLVPVLAMAGLAWHWASPADVRDLTVAILGSATGLAGTVLGFYFARRDPR